MHLNTAVKLTLSNGQQYDLYLTYKRFKNILNKYNVKTMQQLMVQEGDLIISGILYECLPDEAKSAMTLEQFEDQLPFDLDYLAGLVASLFNVRKTEKN